MTGPDEARERAGGTARGDTHAGAVDAGVAAAGVAAAGVAPAGAAAAGAADAGSTPRVLIVVDVQPDFCEGGALPVAGGNAVAAGIAEYLEHHRGRYALVAASRDRHVDPGAHFSAEPDFVASWPPHCVVGTPGANLHPALAGTAFDAVVDKGAHTAAYSAFEGRTADGVALAALLAAVGPGAEVDICGLAADYCVRATALDAARGGWPTRVLRRYTAAVAPASGQAAMTELAAAGIDVSIDTGTGANPGAGAGT